MADVLTLEVTVEIPRWKMWLIDMSIWILNRVIDSLKDNVHA